MLPVPENPFMYVTATNEAQLRVSAQAYDRISAWISQELRAEAYNGLVAAVLYTLVWVAANIFVLVLLSAIISWFLPRQGTLGLAPLLALGVMCAAYPVQYFTYRSTQHRVKLHSGTVILPRGHRKPDAQLTPGDPADQITNALVQFTAFPAWLAAQALHHALAPTRAGRADTGTMARVLVVLLERGQRVSLFDIEDALGTKRLAATLNLLVHMQGVLVWQTDFPAISINDDLRAKLTQFL